MFKKLLYIVLIILISCKEKNRIPNSVIFSHKQKQIVAWYNKVLLLQNNNYLSIKEYADSIIKNSVNEPSNFKALGYISYGIYYSRINDVSLTFKNFNTALSILKITKNDSLLLVTNTGLGNYYKNIGEYPKSSKHLFAALKIAERIKDTLKIASAHANLGQLFQQKEDIEQAKYHLNISKKLLQNNKNQTAYLVTIHTMANLYGMQGDFKSALKLDEEGLKICKKINSNYSKVTFLDNKANCYMYSNHLDSAKYYFNECLKLDLLNKSQKQISDSYSNLAQLASYYKNYSEAISYSNISIEIAKKVNYNPGLVKNYELQIESYKNLGNYQKALEVSEKYHSVYKKIFNEKKETAVAEFKTFYESEKKEKELLISKATLLEKETQIKNKTTQFQILALISLALLVIFYLIFRQQKLKNKQLQKEFIHKTEIKEIENQNKIQEQRLIISKDLQDSLGAQLTYIISSIDNLKFAKLITDSKVEQQLSKISNYTKSTFIELRDTIWAMKNSEYTFEDMQSRISNFTDKALENNSDIDFEFSISNEVKNKKLSIITGINIYRSIQEAINNAIKFSEATQIKVAITQDEIYIKIVIGDNGKGFDLDVVDYGSGIQNIKKRIEEIGGKFTITSTENKGTIITILI